MKNIRLSNVFLLLFCALLVQDSRAQDENPFTLPEGARARLGKGWLSREDRSVAYSPDGTRLAVASSLGIWLYDTHTYTEVALLTDHTGSGYAVVFAPDGKTIVSYSRETVWLWDANSGALKATIEDLATQGFGGSSTWVTSVAFAPDGKTIAISIGDGISLQDMDSILVSDNTVDKGETLNFFLVTEGGMIGPLAFAPDGKILATASGYGIWLWDMDSILASNYTVINTWDMGWALKDTLSPSGSSVVFSPDGKTIASG